MQRFSLWPWLVLAGALLLLPGPAGRLLVDVVGGLTLLLFLLPLLAGTAAVIGWQLLRRRLRSCPACGVISLGAAVCPACGTVLGSQDAPEASAEWGSASGEAIDPRNVTINVQAVDVPSTSGPSVPPSSPQPTDSAGS